MNVLHDHKTGKEYKIMFYDTVFPNGKGGLRVEIMNTDAYPDDLGTLVVENGKLKVIQW